MFWFGMEEIKQEIKEEKFEVSQWSAQHIKQEKEEALGSFV